VSETVRSLRWHWGSAYDIRRAGGRHVAVRRDGLGTVAAETLDGLLVAVRADYARCAVPRVLPLLISARRGSGDEAS
jgi:hypothetical protein